MINTIKICKVASYDSEPEELTGLKKINFIYGSNGTGKTTISRVIRDYKSDIYRNCKLEWKDGFHPIARFVYNRDFVKENFDESEEIKGIFTLGKNDKEINDRIITEKAELDKIKHGITTREETLKGKDAELTQCEEDFKERCWTLKKDYGEVFKEAFKVGRASKANFKERLLKEAASNSSAVVSLEYLKKQIKIVYKDELQETKLLSVPNGDAILAHEEDAILKKKVIGNNDVDIATLIKKLENSDWVEQGREFYNSKERVCPFCQQQTQDTLEHSLNKYFDETFIADTKAIENLSNAYEEDSKDLKDTVQILLDNGSGVLDSEKLQAKTDLLGKTLLINFKKIEEKKREFSKSIELDSLKDVLKEISELVQEANNKIKEQNEIFSNLNLACDRLTDQVWRYLLDSVIKDDLEKFNEEKSKLNKAITNLEKEIDTERYKKSKKESYIQGLEKQTSSIEPTITCINKLLKDFGFTGFKLKKDDRKRFYKIEREDGSDVKETLSEGEKSFITFLYFYHLIKGNDKGIEMTSDRVVVFDDPVSSLDSDILFFVSCLIKGVCNEVKKDKGTSIKQVFVLTHNLYFHKEVTLDPKRRNGVSFKDETFWTVRKIDRKSKVESHESNPVKTSYELLWREVNNKDPDKIGIRNAMRRILEYYSKKILGRSNLKTIGDGFEATEKSIFDSLISWINDGSHFPDDDDSFQSSELMIEKYKEVFKRIFKEVGHISHYKMMIGEPEAPENQSKPSK